MLRIERKTQAYNERRYGKPWIAMVDFGKSPKGEYRWGTWVGSPGESGLLVIDAEPGDVLAMGQRDHRGGNTECDYGILCSDGKMYWLGRDGKAAAYKLSKLQRTERLAEIDRMIIADQAQVASGQEVAHA